MGVHNVSTALVQIDFKKESYLIMAMSLSLSNNACPDLSFQ